MREDAPDEGFTTRFLDDLVADSAAEMGFPWTFAVARVQERAVADWLAEQGIEDVRHSIAGLGTQYVSFRPDQAVQAFAYRIRFGGVA
ncbi:hypothetical protein IPV08_15930 [Methylobacterium sp. SD274]|uniref:hypothetical protein n=1 Tax=Methylobacterium sp. SD274 TaxID=2782009 RepID=UPI001A965744|nr:hypothetical protein [Methylobacterium sp. SD274]MBO1021451.1 hypothetical protein [Methylobacterium sp. SD274]